MLLFIPTSVILLNLDEIWDATAVSDEDVCDCEDLPSMPTFSSDSTAHVIVTWIVVFILSFQEKYFIPNAAINLLVNFLNSLFLLLGKFSQTIQHIYTAFPKSLPAMLKLAGFRQPFSKFIVCCKCLTIYDYNQCIESIGSQRVSKKCQFIAYPNHTQHSRRKVCDYLLLKNVEMSSGHKFLHPIKLYCYSSLKSNLQNLLLKTNFTEQCIWEAKLKSDTLRDVYDGAIWNEFHEVFQT